MKKRLSSNESFPRAFSTQFPEGFKQTKEKVFVPYTDFLLLQRRYERLMRKYLERGRKQ